MQFVALIVIDVQTISSLLVSDLTIHGSPPLIVGMAMTHPHDNVGLKLMDNILLQCLTTQFSSSEFANTS